MVPFDEIVATKQGFLSPVCKESILNEADLYRHHKHSLRRMYQTTLCSCHQQVHRSATPLDFSA
jgi:hypothetical protein